MEKSLIIIAILILTTLSSICRAEGYAVFPESKISNLVLVSLDSDSSSFVIKNQNGEQIRGFRGDFIGIQQSEVVEITNDYLTLETIEIITDEDGKVYEQPSRMQIPLSFASHGHGLIIQR